MAALIGALRVSLSADTAKFEAGMKRAQRTAHGASSGINKSLGLLKSGLVGLASGLSIGLFIRGIQGALDYAGSLAEISQQIGVTSRDLQVLRFAAGQVGVSQSELEKGLAKLTVTLGQVAAGAKAPTKAFAAIGISAKQLASGDTGDAFRLLADGLSNVSSRAERAAIEVAVMGRAGAKLDNLLAGGSSALNELAAAAERLGIVLSDEQIQKADETADKLAAMKTVLSARIAGVVADNADSILQLANALADIAGATAQAFGGIARLFSYIRSNTAGVIEAISALNPALGLFAQAMNLISGGGGGNVRGLNKAGKSVTVALPPVRNAVRGGRNIGQFLAPSGGGGRKGRAAKEDRTAENALRAANQLEEEIRRANMDILRAQRDVAHGYVARYAISIQILDAERVAYKAQLDYEVQLNKLTKGEEGKTRVQADQLLALYDQKDSLDRLGLLIEDQVQAKEDSAHLDQVTADLDRNKLESELQLVETSKEERRLRLLILDHLYRTERARLEAVIADEKASDLAREEARRRLQGLDETQANDRQGVINATRGPMEDWRAQFGDITEELEDLKVRGIMGAVDALGALTGGFDDFADAAKNAIGSVLQELIRLQLMKLAVGLFGGSPTATPVPIPGHASGGFTGMGSHRKFAGFVHGQEFVLNAAATRRLGVPNLNALNRGAPMSAVSNDNRMMAPVTININAPMTRDQARVTGAQAAAGWRTEMAKAAKAGF